MVILKQVEINPIVQLLSKARMSNPRRLQIHELLQEFKHNPILELDTIKQKGLVTALCWLQFNQIAIITNILEQNGETEKIYYGLTVKNEDIPKYIL
jgi:hypothetical protein